MTQKEANERFNALPIEHRTTIIAYYLDVQLRWLEEEKRNYIKAHKKNLDRINERKKGLERWLQELKD